MDMSGLGPLNGLGNTLAYYIHFLKHSILLGRAAFLRRNLPECEPHCSFDPGDFFGAFGGVDYRWSNATACAVARVMALRGEKEHVVSLVFNRSSDAHETVGAFDETTGDFVEVRRRISLPRRFACVLLRAFTSQDPLPPISYRRQSDRLPPAACAGGL